MNGEPSRHLAIADTQSFYEQNAREYFDGTVGIDVSGLRQRFLTYVPTGGRILDAGSGSGRDTRAFCALGYEVEAFDSSPELAELSTRFTGVRTQVKRFEEFDEPARFDGIWACASLLHVSANDLPDVLRRLGQALKPHGALYISFKCGTGEHTFPDGRRFTNMTLGALRHLLRAVDGMLIREVWEYRAQNSSKESEVWVNAIATKT
jgi:SAM-dependent methyltransferase